MNMRVEGTGLLLLEEQFSMQIQIGQIPMSKKITKKEVNGGSFQVPAPSSSHRQPSR